MAYAYPLDVQDLVTRVTRRGAEVVRFVGLEGGMRDDVELTHIAWGTALGWFPVHSDHRWHGALDIGLPDWNGETYSGAPVYALGDGEVVYVEPQRVSAEGYDFGRVIIRHQTPAGEEFYACYKHLIEVTATSGQGVATGDTLGKIGAYGNFPHLSWAIASLSPLGGTSDLIPEGHQKTLPSDEGVFNLLRVQVDALDPAEWPLAPLQGAAGYVYNPIEVVRYCRGEPYLHDIGPGSRHSVLPSTTPQGQSVPPNSETEVKVNPLQSKALKGDTPLVELAQAPTSKPIGKGHSNKESVKAIQRALKACQYNVGRFGPAHDGIDGDYGPTTERIVKDFQKNKLKDLFAGDAGKRVLSQFGQTTANARADGAIDWLTLIALDIYAAAHENAPPLPTPPVIPNGASPAAPPAAGEISLEEAKMILLKCTAFFEGTWRNNDFNFGVLAPNFDRAALSAGIIQWNIKSCSLFPLLEKFYQECPDEFQKCYEAGNPERFKVYFASAWPSPYEKDVWKFSEFVKFISTSTTNTKHHYLWAKLLHKPNAIKPVPPPSDGHNWDDWVIKDGFTQANKALQPELTDFFKRLGQIEKFHNIQLTSAWSKFGDTAIDSINWLRTASHPKFPTLLQKIELRTLAAIFDLTIQQGSFGSPKHSEGNAKPTIQSNIASKTYGSQKEIVQMAVLERAKRASTNFRNDCASRRLGFLNAQATYSGNLGPHPKKRENCNYALLKDNPYVQGI